MSKAIPRFSVVDGDLTDQKREEWLQRAKDLWLQGAIACALEGDRRRGEIIYEEARKYERLYGGLRKKDLQVIETDQSASSKD